MNIKLFSTYIYVLSCLVMRGDSTLRRSSEEPPVDFPAIFSSPMSPKGTELYNSMAQLDILDVIGGRAFYLVSDENTLTRYGLFIPEITYENERTKALKVLPRPYRSKYSERNDYPTISNAFSCFRSLEGSFQTVTALETKYPSLVEVVNIGPTYLKTVGRGGYDIQLLKLTNKNSKVEEKSHLFVTGALHVRELATAEAVARFAEHMLSNYGTDADVSWILDHTELHVVLQSNPDGREDEESQVSNGVYYFRRKNMNFNPSTNSCSAADGGVDLNRNFPHSAWGTVGVSSNLCSSIYPGKSPGSEPEVDAIVKYVESVLPPGTNTVDGNGAYSLDSTGVLIDVHSYGEDFFYPWGYKDQNPPNHVSLVAMAKKLASYTTPKYSTHNEVYATAGDTTDWAYESVGTAAYTMELGNDFYQSCSYFENKVAPSAIGALLYAARVSKAPYLYPKGPDIIDITLLSDSADTLNVKVKASDSKRADGYSTGSQAISEISVFLDVHPYDDSSSATAIADSGFTSSTETSTLSVDVSDLADGKHTIYVRAKDADGTPGPVYASYFTVPLEYDSDDPGDDTNDDNGSGNDNGSSDDNNGSNDDWNWGNDNNWNDDWNDCRTGFSKFFKLFKVGSRHLRGAYNVSE